MLPIHVHEAYTENVSACRRTFVPSLSQIARYHTILFPLTRESGTDVRPSMRSLIDGLPLPPNPILNRSCSVLLSIVCLWWQAHRILRLAVSKTPKGMALPISGILLAKSSKSSLHSSVSKFPLQFRLPFKNRI